MKKVTTMMLAFLAFTAFTFAQEDDSYVMYENTRIGVKTDKYKEFGKAMAHHNKTYHSGGAHHANVWMVSVGKKSGQMIWSMGPATFAQHDNRPDGTEHMEDWLYNVMPNVRYTNGTNLWKMSTKHSYTPEGHKGNTKLSIRVYDIKDGQGYRFKEVLAKALEVYNVKKYDWPFSTYWPQFDTEADEDVALVWGFEQWAWFDKDNNFKKDFEEVHGEGAWQSFIDELRGTVDSSKDEVWELVPELSGSME